MEATLAVCPITGAAGERPQSLAPVPRIWPEPRRVSAEAHEYLCLLEREGVIESDTQVARMRDIEASLTLDGTYSHTATELEYGAKVAWRNSSRCIGRLYWQKLAVRDLRHLDDPDEIFDALVDHLRSATNGGKVLSTISVFAPQAPGSPGIRIWNSQMIRYAGYRRTDGTVLGDPLNLEFTELVQRMGWKGGAGTPFDLLPIVIQMPGDAPQLYELPPEVVLEVPLSHPDYPWFEELELKWHALPVIANMRMEIGGISYSAAPFNGWYMGTEIGARNLADTTRYDLLPVIARCMGLDTRSNRKLWRDRAMVELNVAVLHSYQLAGVTIIDHHTAAKHFIRHEEFEREADRPLAADWSWIVPPLSGAATEVFHREYHDTLLKPNYFGQPNPWEGFFPAEPHPRREVQGEQADLDGLTGLIHRGALDRKLMQFGRQGGVLAILDLDAFAAINEKHGQPVGNAFLRAAGQTVVGTVRPDDTCARYGGDSFCLLLEGVETEFDAIAVGDRIRTALARVQLDEAPTVELRASIGMTFVEPGSNVYAALDLAEKAVDQAKAAGGDRILLLEPRPEDTPPPRGACPFTGATEAPERHDGDPTAGYSAGPAHTLPGFPPVNGNGRAHTNGNGKAAYTPGPEASVSGNGQSHADGNGKGRAYLSGKEASVNGNGQSRANGNGNGKAHVPGPEASVSGNGQSHAQGNGTGKGYVPGPGAGVSENGQSHADGNGTGTAYPSGKDASVNGNGHGNGQPLANGNDNGKAHTTDAETSANGNGQPRAGGNVKPRGNGGGNGNSRGDLTTPYVPPRSGKAGEGWSGFFNFFRSR